jgi:hypothetical protein
MLSFELVIQIAMIVMPLSVAVIFFQLIFRAIRNPKRTPQSLRSAINRTMAGVSIGISYHLIATALGNSIILELGGTHRVEVWIVEFIFLAAITPAVVMLVREARRLNASMSIAVKP